VTIKLLDVWTQKLHQLASKRLLQLDRLFACACLVGFSFSGCFGYELKIRKLVALPFCEEKDDLNDYLVHRIIGNGTVCMP